ncbi:MAG: hypothetical protein GY810_31265 [Aureispira sp.]|nr:hypothetical protein [Aureispira sp.]
MNSQYLLFVALFIMTIGCNTTENNTAENDNSDKTEHTNSEDTNKDNLQAKVSLESVLGNLNGDDKTAAKWLYENYKGRLNEGLPITKALEEMGSIASVFDYGDASEEEINNEVDTYCKKYDGKIDLSHLKAKHSCMHGFMGADETNPYFSEFEFIGKSENGSYAFNCTITAENFKEGQGEQKYVEVTKEGDNFMISMIRCRASI